MEGKIKIVNTHRWIKLTLWGLCSIPVLIALLGALSFYFPTEAPVSEDIRLLRQLQKDYISYIQENTNLVCTSTGSTGLNPIEGFLFYFRCPERVEQSEIHKARKIALNCSETLLNMINSNEALKPYLVCNPFNFRNINLSIFFISDRKDPQSCMSLRGVSIRDGEVSFNIYNDEEYGHITLFREPYSEAIRLAKLENFSRIPSD
jgi:hypothetical protein